MKRFVSGLLLLTLVLTACGSATTTAEARGPRARGGRSKAPLSKPYAQAVKSPQDGSVTVLGASTEATGTGSLQTTATIQAARSPYPRPFVLSGIVTGGGVGETCVVEVRKPGSARWSYSSARRIHTQTELGGKWSYRYTPKLRGAYRFRVRFDGHANRLPSMSGVISVNGMLTGTWIDAYQNRIIIGVRTKSKLVALTFDDGPMGMVGPISDVLTRYGVRATFLYVGGRASDYSRDAKAGVTAGEEIADHTWNHVEMRGLTRTEAARQVDLTDARIESLTGSRPLWFRPRSDKIDGTAMGVVCSRGHLVANWTVMASGATSRSMADSVLNGVRPGAIVLMHASGSVPMQALPAILSGLSARGYKVVTLSELARAGTPVFGKSN